MDGRGLLFVLGSAVLHTTSFLLLQRGYRRGDLSLVYPLARGTGPLHLFEIPKRARVRDRAQMLRGLVPRHAATIRAVFTHGVEAINDGKNAGGERNLFALQSVWIA